MKALQSTLPTDLEEALRVVPGVIERLSRSHAELQARAERVERELVRTNAELESKVLQLDALKRHLEAVLESLPNGVIERDAEGRIARVNAAAQRILGTDAEELRGRKEHAALPARAADGEARETVRPDGRRAVLASHYATVRLADGSVRGSVEILDDRTEATALAERLHAADKMAALGTLAAGVAHEIRNPLNAVKGFAALIEKAARTGEGSPERLGTWAGHIVAGAAGMDALIANMLTFGSPERLLHDHIEPGALLRGALDAARSGGECAGEDARFELRSEAPPFVGDRLKLRQALRNLVENALVAQEGGGSVLLASALEDDEIVLRVADSGPGVPAELRGRVFDPFFTTRADGTGLGLALVATIARLHDGRVEVSAEPSELGGAEFLLRLPYQPAPEPRPTH